LGGFHSGEMLTIVRETQGRVQWPVAAAAAAVQPRRGFPVVELTVLHLDEATRTRVDMSIRQSEALRAGARHPGRPRGREDTMTSRPGAVEVRPAEPAVLEHCAARGYHPVALADLRGAVAMLAGGEADVTVVADERHLHPMIEIVSHEGRRSA